MKQPPLLDDAPPEQADAQHAEIDQAHAKRTEKALAAKREWFVERVTLKDGGDAVCAVRLDTISNNEAGLIHSVQLMPDGSFVIIWWGWN